MIIFAMYALKVRGDSGASGGHISNTQLIMDTAAICGCAVLAPGLSPRAVDLFRQGGVEVITSEFPQTGLRARFQKRRWLSRHLHWALCRGGVAAVFSTNGVTDIAAAAIRKSKASASHVIITRAFEDLYYSKYVGNTFARLKCLTLDALALGAVARSYRSADLIVTNSLFMRAVVSNYFGLHSSMVEVLYPPLSASFSDFVEPGQEITIGIINPSPRKGEAVMIGLADANPNIVFKYFGPVDRNFHRSNVLYCGWKADVSGIFCEIDILIVPSLWHEPLGRAAIEAIAHGRIALVSDRGGLPETVDPFFVVADDTCGTWNSAIRRVLDDKNSSREAWQRSAARLDRFLEKSHGAAIKSVIERITNGS